MRKPAGPTASWVIGTLVSLNDLYLSPSLRLCASNRPWPLLYCLPAWAGGEGPCSLGQEAGQLCRGTAAGINTAFLPRVSQLIAQAVGHMASNELWSYSTLLERKRSYGQKVNNDGGPDHMQFHLEILKFEFCFVLFLRLSVGSRLASNPWSFCLSLSRAEITSQMPSYG